MRRVVITGMGAITPLGNSVDEFWSGIKAGKSGIGPITQFDASINKVHYAAEVKNFNPGDYMDPKDARKMARFTQFGVAAAKQCIEDAGLMGNSEVLDETGIILGVGIGGLEVTESSVLSMQKMGFVKTNPMAIPELIPNEVGGNIAINFGLHGPVQSIATACSSGSDAMGVAFDMVRSGRLDTCLTGGSEATICQFGVVSFEVLHALSTGFDDDPTKASRPFDKNRNGFVMGEGSGMLMFEEYEHAKARGAKIYAEIIGFGTNQDGNHITTPNQDTMAKALQLAIDDAGISPDQIGYVNAHGTSTGHGDVAETNATESVFKRPVPISSTKSYTGHTLGCCGCLEAWVTIQMMNDGWFHPTLNLTKENLDPACGKLDYIMGEGREIDTDIVMSNNFAFGGVNTSLIFKKCN